MSAVHASAFRRSAVTFDESPAERMSRGGWEVVLRYENEAEGPWLIDLSHRARWDFQDGEVGSQRPLGAAVPATPGEVDVQDGLTINRMNRTQVALWHLGPGDPPTEPLESAFTNMTDGHCMIAFVGPGVPSVMEHLTRLDLFPSPSRGSPGLPRLSQGPVLHVPCQVVAFDVECVVLTFSRGYGQAFVEAALVSARPCGLRPGGEAVFSRWYERWMVRRS